MLSMIKKFINEFVGGTLVVLLLFIFLALELTLLFFDFIARIKAYLYS